MRGRFITFEGGEGSGKTSAIHSLAKYLEEQGYDVLVTREPGGINIAEQIRQVILNKDNVEMDQLTEAFLFAASRRQHLVEKVVPALEAGKIVLCDRFVDSSVVYQGYAREIGMEKVMNINEIVINGYMPHLTLFIDVLPETGMRRILENLRKVNRLDLEEKAFHQKVYEGYHILAKQHDRIKIINGELSKEEVFKQTVEVVEGFLNAEQV